MTHQFSSAIDKLIFIVLYETLLCETLNTSYDTVVTNGRSRFEEMGI